MLALAFRAFLEAGTSRNHFPFSLHALRANYDMDMYESNPMANSETNLRGVFFGIVHLCEGMLS